MEQIEADDHHAYMRAALSQAERSPAKPSNFRVGAILVDGENNQILSTGYTLELPGNTHAEQCCLEKFASIHSRSVEEVGDILPSGAVIYTTMEPCNKRLSGNLPCVDRILNTRSGGNGGIKTVYLGAQEPETFVGQNTGRARLEAAGIKCVHVTGFEEEILEVATTGHEKEDSCVVINPSHLGISSYMFSVICDSPHSTARQSDVLAP